MKARRSVKITRKSIIGFGYNTTPTGNGIETEKTTRPDFIGSPKTCISKKRNDPVFKSLRNCYMSRSWFIKIDGEWHKIVDITDGYWNAIGDDLDTLNEKYQGGGFLKDSLTAEIE